MKAKTKSKLAIISIIIVLLGIMGIISNAVDSVTNTYIQNEYRLALFAQQNPSGFLNLSTGLIGKDFAQAGEAGHQAINETTTALCFGHVTGGNQNGSWKYHVENIIDIDYNSNVTIYKNNGVPVPQTGANRDGALLAYLARESQKGTTGVVNNWNNKAKVTLTAYLGSRVNGIFRNDISAAFGAGLSSYVADSTIESAAGKYAANATEPIVFEDKTTGTPRVNVVGAKTYIGPYKINYTCSLSSIMVNVKGENKSSKYARVSNGQYKEYDITQTPIPVNTEFYIVVDNAIEARDINSIKIVSTAERIRARIMLLMYRNNDFGTGGQYLAVYSTETSPQNNELNLTSPELEIKNSEYQLNFEKIEEEQKQKIDATFRVNYSNGTTETVNTNNGVFSIKHDAVNGEETITLTETAVTDSNKYELLGGPITIKITKKNITTSSGDTISVADKAIVSGNGVEQKTYTFTESEQNNKVVSTLQNIKITITDKIKYKPGSYNLGLNKKDSKNGANLAGAKFEVKVDGVSKGQYTTNSNGILSLDGFIADKETTEVITLTEISAPAHYEKLSKDIVLNVSITADKTNHAYVISKITLNDNNQATCEIYNSDLANHNQTINIIAKNDRKMIKLSGYVWEDEKQAKESKIDGIKNSNEKFINGMQVTLHTEDGSNIIYTNSATLGAKTGMNNKDGYYEFTVPEYDKGYYVEFTYNGQVYQHTKYTPWSSTSSANGITSNATETEKTRNSLNATLEEITPNTQVNSSINSNPDPTFTSNSLYTISAYTGAYGNEKNIKYYSKTSSDINLGITKRETADLAIQKDVYKANLSIKGYTQEYVYNKREGLETDVNGNSYWDISARASDIYYGTNYTRDIKISDYNYSGADSLKATVTYKITIKNQSEGIRTKVTEIVDYYDNEYSYVGAYIGDKNGNRMSDLTASTSSKYSSSTTISNYSKIYLTGMENATLEPAQYMYIYVTFEVRTENGKILLDENDSGKGNIVEIMGYRTYYSSNSAPNEGNGNTYTEYRAGDIAGRVEQDSNPGNTTSDNINTFEDDTDRAPYIKFQLSSTERTINGNVWEDARTQNVNNAMVGDGIRQDGEAKVSGVKVELWEVVNGASQIAKVWNGTSWVDAITTTDGNGQYTFSSYVPGEYYVKFIYGKDGESHSGQDYKSAIYHYEQVNPDFNYDSPDVLGTLVETVENYSDARDVWGNESSEGTRAYVNALYAGETENKKAVELNADIGKVWMQAITGKITVNIEKEPSNTSSDQGRTFIYPNIDFAIQQRAKAQLKLDKEVSNVKVILANGNTLFDASGKGSTNVWWTNKKYHTSGYTGNLMNIPTVRGNTQSIQLTMDEELMHGATIQITYALKVTNIGEADYTGNRFYYTGNAAGASIAKTTVYDIIDYVGSTGSDDSKAKANNLQFNKTINDGWDNVSSADLINNGTVSSSIAAEVAKYKTIIKYSFNTALTPQILGEEGSYVSTSLVLSQVMSSESSTDDFTYNNIAEITKFSNDNARKMEYSIVGNQNPSAQIAEVDSDSAQSVTVLPPFGQTYIYYILGIGIAIIAIAGIIIIKKKVVKK